MGDARYVDLNHLAPVWNSGSVDRDRICQYAVDQLQRTQIDKLESSGKTHIRSLIMAIISSWLAILASVTVSALALPTTPNAGPNTALLMPRGAEGEPFTCPDPTGTAAAKSKLIQYGAQSVGKWSSLILSNAEKALI